MTTRPRKSTPRKAAPAAPIPEVTVSEVQPDPDAVQSESPASADPAPLETGEALPAGQCDDTEPHGRHDILWGDFGSTDYRTCEGVEAESEADLLGYCPTRAVCFPYGQPINAHHVSCVHGENFAAPAE